MSRTKAKGVEVKNFFAFFFSSQHSRMLYIEYEEWSDEGRRRTQEIIKRGNCQKIMIYGRFSNLFLFVLCLTPSARSFDVCCLSSFVCMLYANCEFLLSCIKERVKLTFLVWRLQSKEFYMCKYDFKFKYERRRRKWRFHGDSWLWLRHWWFRKLNDNIDAFSSWKVNYVAGWWRILHNFTLRQRTFCVTSSYVNICRRVSFGSKVNCRHCRVVCFGVVCTFNYSNYPRT